MNKLLQLWQCSTTYYIKVASYVSVLYNKTIRLWTSSRTLTGLILLIYLASKRIFYITINLERLKAHSIPRIPAHAKHAAHNSNTHSVKGTRRNRIGVGLKFVYLNSLNKKYIMDQYVNCTITYQACITAASFAWRVLPCRRASVRVRETMR